jgi:hypothetical protein
MYIEIDTKVLIPDCDGKVVNNLTNRSIWYLLDLSRLDILKK